MSAPTHPWADRRYLSRAVLTVPPEKLAAIRQRVDLAQLVGETVALRKQGRSYVARCPFHQEKTPSFSVTPDKGMFYCFGCHAGGDAFAFVMRTQGLDFMATVRLLAERFGVELAPLSPQQAEQQALLARIELTLGIMARIVSAALWQPSGTQAQRYLAGRAIPAAQARQTGLGLGPPDEVLFEAAQKAGVTAAALTEAGLVAQGGGHIMLAQRLTLPIRDAQGRLVGFGARRLNDHQPGPKYLNSRDTSLFHKRRVLYGLDAAQAGICQRRQVVVVEGFFDVLAAHRAGVDNAVAALGTQLTAEHATMCRRIADEVVLVLDGDRAGQAASLAAAQLFIGAGLQVRLATLPHGSDPDSVVRQHGAGMLQEAIKLAQPAIERCIAKLSQFGANQVEERASCAHNAMDLIAASPFGVGRDLYISRLASALGLAPAQLCGHIEQRKQVQERKNRTSSAAQQKKVQAPSLAPKYGQMERMQATPQKGRSAPSSTHAAADYELGMVRELLLFPTVWSRLEVLEEYLFIDENRLLLRDLAQAPADPKAIAAIVTEKVLDEKWRKRLLAVRPMQPSKDDSTLDQLHERANHTFDDILRRLKRRHVDAALKYVLGELAEAEAQGHATDSLMRRKRDLSARKRALTGLKQASR